MRASRLLSILILLQLRARLTAEALAQEFEVSVRTIYRDIDELSAAGIPVYGDRGPGGGFQLLDGYRTRLTGLDSDEAEAMMMIGMPAAATALGLGAAAMRTTGKLLAALPAKLSADAQRIGERFHLDPVDWYRSAEPVSALPAIVRAVLDQRMITMTYDSWSALRDWRIAPLGVVQKAGSWYVVGQSGDKISIFKITNIRSHIIDEERFIRPDDFDLPRWWGLQLERFDAQLRQENASLMLSELGRKRLSLCGDYAARAVAAAKPADSDGWASLELPIESINQAALLLLGLGAEVKVIAPLALRDQLRTFAMQVAEIQSLPALAER